MKQYSAFLEGVARLLDWRGTLNAPPLQFPDRRTPAQRLRADWIAVGGYFRAVLSRMPSRPDEPARLPK